MTELINDVIYIDVEEWCALYINGKLVGEGDGMYLVDELDGLTNMSFNRRAFIPSDEDYVMEFGKFPDNLQELLDYPNK